MKISRRTFLKKSSLLPAAMAFGANLVTSNLVNATGDSGGTSEWCPYMSVKTGAVVIWEKIATCPFVDQHTVANNYKNWAATLDQLNPDLRIDALDAAGFNMKPPGMVDLWEESCWGLTRPTEPGEDLDTDAVLLWRGEWPGCPAQGIMTGDTATPINGVPPWEIPGEWGANWPVPGPPDIDGDKAWYWNIGDQNNVTFKGEVHVKARLRMPIDCWEFPLLDDDEEGPDT
jgi:hypothetical protein